MKKILLLLIAFSAVKSFGQDKVYESFAGTRVINNHSTECIERNNLEFIVAHKFGDLAGESGGISNFFGFDNLADVRLAFEYGILGNLDVGLGRSKGVGIRTQVVDGYVKYKILEQKTSKMPISMAFVSSIALPYAKKAPDSTSVTSYPRFINRFIFTNQLLITRKFGDRFTWQINLGYNHRNLVAFGDVNGLYFAGTSARFRFTKTLAVLCEYSHVFNRPSSIPAQDPLSFGFEILTGGHTFSLHFSNAKAMNENLFIPLTTSNWLDGQFRFGFFFNRRFQL
ncbi:DUF5777 family beta-barrel protein [Paracrocinitomix mangrovi]|uniref:DUF5777 family beta-barrel protein n=1 Tax=Paracrocinitomix mangrovi TaxID=2862509 RepID=UPI001C8E70FD|nr:DUF5777 family beta-barrel protein [Paracrocinitomix mangrovi]UKN03225.1 DUF5777 family beta-barrel protein [Paracrocinitomix mangrovi]